MIQVMFERIYFDFHISICTVTLYLTLTVTMSLRISVELDIINAVENGFSTERAPHVFSAVDFTIDDDENFSKYLQRQEQRNITSSEQESYFVSCARSESTKSNALPATMYAINRQHKRSRVNPDGPFTNV